MQRYRCLICWCLLAPWVVLPAAAQPQRFRFEHLTIADGLPENLVREVLQDRLGFLWLATQNGLARYDGYTLRAYKNDPEGPHAFRGRQILALHEGPTGTLWVGTDFGLQHYDRAADRFIHHDYGAADSAAGGSAASSGAFVYTIHEDRAGRIWTFTPSADHNLAYLSRVDAATGGVRRYGNEAPDAAGCCLQDPRALLEDAAGRIWVGTPGGLFRYDPATDRFEAVLGSGRGQDSLAVYAIYEAPSEPGVLWLTGSTAKGWNVLVPSWEEGNGLTRYDPKTGAHLNLRPGQAAHPGLTSSVVMGVHEDRQGQLWATTARGLCRIHRPDLRFTCFLPEPQRPAAEANRIYSITEDRSGAFWLRGHLPPVYHFDPASGVFTPFENDPSDPASLGGRNVVFSIYEDRSGVMWFGTGWGGLNRLDRSRAHFVQHRHDPQNPHSLSQDYVRALAEGSDGAVWIGTGVGLDRWDRAANTFRHYRHDPDDAASLGAGAVRALLQDRQGILWVGTVRSGLSRMDVRTERFTRYRTDPADAATLGSDHVSALLEDRRGRLWVGTYDGGLNRFDPAANRFVRYPYRAAPQAGVSDSLDNEDVLSLFEDRAGRIWIGTTRGGLNRLDPETGIFTSYFDEDGGLTMIVSIFEDRKGRLWAGSYLGGLFLVDPLTGAVTRYTERDGLAHDHVAAIAEDADGYLWLGTERGLVRFDPEHRTFRTFTAGDGLETRSFTGPALRARDGTFLFSGDDGLVAFEPARIRVNTTAPQLVIQAVSYPEHGSDGTPTEVHRRVVGQDEVRLAHDENNVTFTYVGLHFESPARNRYAYILEGFDEEWIDAGTQRSVKYTNLDPGRYTFRVKAANSDGVWNETGAALQLMILPPWWRTPWAYAVYALLFAGGLVAIGRVQRHRLLKREREWARERALAREREHAREIEQAYYQLDAAHRHLQATQKQLVQQEKMASLGALTAGIAHEIKNPLNFVNNFAGLSRELADELREAVEAGDLDEVQSLLRDLALNASKIEEHGRRADGIVRSMLEHARGGTGERVALNLNALVQDHVSLAYHGKRAQTPGFEVRLEQVYDEAVGSVMGVPQEIGRVVLNLVRNALDAVGDSAARRAAMHENPYTPRVEVATRRTGAVVEVCVTDNGPGIPEDLKTRIFEPFFTTKPPGQGTGLGLSISYDIITQGHAGTLKVESTPGQGTTFTIALPAFDEALPVATTSLSTAAEIS